MKKKITKTHEVEVLCCDFCERELKNSMYNCRICNKLGCYACVKFMPLYTDIVGRCFADQFIHVCTSCNEAGEDVCGVSYQQSLRVLFDKADRESQRVIRLWKEWAERRRDAPSDKVIATRPVR